MEQQSGTVLKQHFLRHLPHRNIQTPPIYTSLPASNPALAESRRRKKEERVRQFLEYAAWGQTVRGQLGYNYDLLLRLFEYMPLADLYHLSLAHPVFTQLALDFVWRQPPSLLYLIALLPRHVVTVHWSERSMVVHKRPMKRDMTSFRKHAHRIKCITNQQVQFTIVGDTKLPSLIRAGVTLPNVRHLALTGDRAAHSLAACMAAGPRLRNINVGCMRPVLFTATQTLLLDTFFFRLAKATTSQLHTIQLRFGRYSPPPDVVATIIATSAVQKVVLVAVGQSFCPDGQIMSALARSRVQHIACQEYVHQCNTPPASITLPDGVPYYGFLTSADLSHLHAVQVIGPGFSLGLTSLRIVFTMVEDLELETDRVLSLIGENCSGLLNLNLDLVVHLDPTQSMLSFPLSRLFGLRHLTGFSLCDTNRPSHFQPPSDETLHKAAIAWPLLNRFHWAINVEYQNPRGADHAITWPGLSALDAFATMKNLLILTFPIDPRTPAGTPKYNGKFVEGSLLNIGFQGCSSDDDVPVHAVVEYLRPLMPNRALPRLWLGHQFIESIPPPDRPFSRCWTSICSALQEV